MTSEEDSEPADAEYDEEAASETEYEDNDLDPEYEEDASDADYEDDEFEEFEEPIIISEDKASKKSDSELSENAIMEESEDSEEFDEFDELEEFDDGKTYMSHSDVFHIVRTLMFVVFLVSVIYSVAHPFAASATIFMFISIVVVAMLMMAEKK